MVTVVGGLILSFILWFVGYLPTVWEGLKKLVSWFWGMSVFSIVIPAWLLGLLLVGCLPVLWRIGLRIVSSFVPDAVAPSNNKIQLSDNENVVLKALASVNGGPVTIEVIAHTIKQNQLRTEQAIDLLIRKDFVQSSHNIIYGTSYYLSDHGRNFVIELGYA